MNLRTNPPIPFIDVAAQRRRLGSAIDAAVGRVLNHCQFILGPEVRAFEAELAAFCGARHVVTCASGTDALVLALRAMGVGPGDAVRSGEAPPVTGEEGVASLEIATRCLIDRPATAPRQAPRVVAR